MIRNKIANKRWTEEDATFVKNNLGKLSFEQMGRALNRSAMSVRLFCIAQSPYCRIASQAQYSYGDVEDKVPTPRRLYTNKNLLHGNGN